MSSSISHQIKSKAKPNDIFYTPTTVVKEAINITRRAVERFKSLDPIFYKYKTGYVAPKFVWYDPFFGNGQFYNNFPPISSQIPEFVDMRWAEIEKGRDFFTYPVQPIGEEIEATQGAIHGTRLVIASNPPFSMIDKVLERTVELKPAVITYILALHGLTPKRMEFMEKNGYNIAAIHMCKVFKWYGMSAIVCWNKHQYQIPYALQDKPNAEMNVNLTYDRIVHRYKDE